MAIRVAALWLAVVVVSPAVADADAGFERGPRFSAGLRLGIAGFHDSTDAFAIGLGASMQWGFIRVESGFEGMTSPFHSGTSVHGHVGGALAPGPSTYIFATAGVRHLDITSKENDVQTSQNGTARLGIDYGGSGGHVVLAVEGGRTLRHTAGRTFSGTTPTDETHGFFAMHVDVSVRFE